jgi:acetolactate synthase-1/2/3 large subunit
MKMKLSDYVANFLVTLGIRHAFIVSGGASIHLLHSLHHHSEITPICTHHEQAAAMAADGYARATGGMGCAIGTSGPGATNMITGIAGAWFDSIPVIYITGQVTTFRLKGDTGVRQYGFQETEILPMVKPITKYSVQLSDPLEIRVELEKAVYIARQGRPGPVLIDLPDDLQRTMIDVAALKSFTHSDQFFMKKPTNEQMTHVIDMLKDAKRPVMVWGNGIRLSGAEVLARRLAECWQIPVLTSWGARDMLPSHHNLNVGTFGTHGTRAGNFVMQNADFVLAIGSRLSTRETGSPLKDWARGAKVVVVDIDVAELQKFEAFDRPVESTIVADAHDFLNVLSQQDAPVQSLSLWHTLIQDWKEKYSIMLENPVSSIDVNPYSLIRSLTKAAPQDAHIFTDTGCSVAWLMQAGELRGKQRTHHDFNNTAMGWGLPAAIAGALALKRTTLCLTGDGSLMMNLQELSTVRAHELPIKIVLLDNSGYSMVRQTEEQWLGGLNVGTSIDSGLSFPKWDRVADAFDLPYQCIKTQSDISEGLAWLFGTETASFLHVVISPNARVKPQVSFGYGIEDAEPHLPRKEFLEQLLVPPLQSSLEHGVSDGTVQVSE